MIEQRNRRRSDLYVIVIKLCENNLNTFHYNKQSKVSIVLAVKYEEKNVPPNKKPITQES